MMVPIQFIDANGNIAIRYELRNIATAPSQPQSGNVHGGLGVAGMLKIIETVYGKSNKFLMKYIEARGAGSKRAGEDPIGVELAKSLGDSINSPQTSSIGAQRLNPEERTLEVDRHAGREEEREESRYEREQEMKQRDYTRGLEQGDRLYTSISDVITSRPPIFCAMFQGQGGRVQMPGSVLEELVRLIGQNGQPQQTQARPQWQYGLQQDLTAQQAITSHQRMVEDQQFVNGIQRMQEAQREKQAIAEEEYKQH